MSVGTVQVVGVSGGPAEPRPLQLGASLVFGRDPEAELPLGGDPWLSRRMGEIRVLDSGVQVVNLSRKHALHVESRDSAIKLPAAAAPDGAGAYLLPAGGFRIGTAAMLRDKRWVRVVVSDGWGPASSPPPAAAAHTRQLSTQPRMKLNPETKVFMVALVLCLPWLKDVTRLAPLPTAPLIAEEALYLSDAFDELKKFRLHESAREAVTGQVRNALNDLKDKLHTQRLINDKTGLGHDNIAAALLYYDIITRDHLALPGDPKWRAAQHERWHGSV
jgi:hypothetical protein